MFEKLLSVLPYNPGIAHQLSFYSRRMREEASIRRTGMIFLVLAFMVQFMAVLSPPQPTSASSNNDLINGGITGAADARAQCAQNTQHYGNIMEYYGISCADIAGAPTVNIQSTQGNNYYSMGRNSYGQSNPTTGRATNQTPVNIPKLGTVYVRLLHSFDGGPYSSYQALKIKSSATGKVFFILYDCGNLVSVGVPQPYTPQGGLGQNQVVSKPGKTGLGQNQIVTKPQPKPKPVPPNTPVCQYNSTLPPNSPECQPCDQASSANPLGCVVIHKYAANTTTGLADANGSTANPGDVITYTLSAEATGKADVPGFIFSENLSDVLDYADVVDLHGGTMNGDMIVNWPTETLKSGKPSTHDITVKIKDPIPQTPAAPGDPNHFDLVMTNVYGDTINIYLPGSPEKTIETAAATLPNTGPGTSIMIAAAIVIVGGYFYGRARLLSQESRLAVQENAGA